MTNELTCFEIDAVAGGNACTQATATYGGAVATLVGVMAIGSGPIGWAMPGAAAYAGLASVSDIAKNY